MVDVRTLRIVGLALVLGLSGTAFADDVQSAREHYMKGTRAFDLGHYKEAVGEYEAAYTAKDDPALLFNIAQAYRLMGDNENALRTYKSFLHHVPNSDNRPEVERRIAELQALVDEARAKAAAQPSTSTAVTEAPKTQPATDAPDARVATATPVAPAPLVDNGPRARRMKVGGIATMALGVALLGAGGGFVAGAKSAADEVNHPANGMFSPSAESRRDTFQTLDVTCFVVGGVALATGLTVYLLGHRLEHRAGAQASRGLQLTEATR